MTNIFDKILNALRSSRHFHLRESEIYSLDDFVDLLDRFIDDAFEYPLEWDDFISWENSNPGIEKLRLEIASLELDFTCGTKLQKENALSAVKSIRDRAALLSGRATKYIDIPCD